MFKGFANFATLMKEIQEIKGRAQEVQEKLGLLRAEGSAGGRMVVVQADGLQRVLSVKIDPSLIDSGDAEMLEDLVLAATNQALDKAKDAATEEMSQMTSSLDLPGISELMSKLGLGGNNSRV